MARVMEQIKEMDRRIFLTALGLGGAYLALGPAASALAGAKEPFSLPELPWAQDALAPHLSAKTIGIHYGKHHAGYVKKLNKAVAGSKWAELPLEKLIKATFGQPGIYNNAAQIWNHTFYWKSMKPGGGGDPTGKLAVRIREEFGSVPAFKTLFAKAAATQFGSGWAWLVEEKGKLKITASSNADTPLSHNQKPLLCIDVWEHAYYLDYQNNRAAYIKAFLDKLINWDFAAANLG